MPPQRIARTNAQRYFLTYSQVDIATASIHALADYLIDRHTVSSSCEWLEIVHEKHQDGGDHYHAVVVFSARYVAPITVFDFNGFHPNIKSIASAGKQLNDKRKYIRKSLNDIEPPLLDALFVTRGSVPEYTAVATTRDKWADIIDAPDQDSFLALAKTRDPKSYCLRYFDLLKFAQHKYNTPSYYVPEFPRESFTNVPEEAEAWVEEVMGEVSNFRLDGSNLPCLLIM